MKIHALIADDEPLARERLRFLLMSDPDVEIVGECRNGTEVISSLNSGQAYRAADVLFLDIQMPGLDGFEAIEAIQQAQEQSTQRLPITIFVTAHNQYAIRAFEVHALDYLTKPVEPERLHSTLVRVKRSLASNYALKNQERLLKVLAELHPAQISDDGRSPVSFLLEEERSNRLESRVNCQYGTNRDMNAPSRDYPKRLLIPNGQKDIVVSINEIEWIEAADYYSCLHIGTKTYMLRATVKQLSTDLDPGQFVRIHRSVIVNMDYVCEIAREGRGEGAVILTRGQRLRMSKAGWQNLLAASGSL